MGEKKVNKECCLSLGSFENKTNTHSVQYYFNHYGQTLQVLEDLYAEALKDFPDLKREDVKYVMFGGISKKYITGIRFSAEIVEIPEGMRDLSKRLKDAGYMETIANKKYEWECCMSYMDELLF